jgi:hypothetical protein
MAIWSDGTLSNDRSYHPTYKTIKIPSYEVENLSRSLHNKCGNEMTEILISFLIGKGIHIK